MAEVWLLSDVLHQLKLRLATLSGGSNEGGAWEQLQQNTQRDTMNTTDKSLGCLHLRLCFFLTKVARILIRYKEKTLIKFSGLQLEQSTFNCYFSGKEISQDAQSRQVWENRQDEDAQCSSTIHWGHRCSKARMNWEISILGPEARWLLLRWRKRGDMSIVSTNGTLWGDAGHW